MKVFLREWHVYSFIKDERGIGSLKLKTVVWDNRVFKPIFFSKDTGMQVKDLILKLQELDPEDQVVVVYDEDTVKVNNIVLEEYYARSTL